MADSRLARPYRARHRLGDDRDLLGVSDLAAHVQLLGTERVSFREPAAIHQRKTDRLEVAGRCGVFDGAPRLFASIAVHLEDGGNPVVIEWNTGADRGLQHAGVSLQSVFEHSP